MNRRRFLNLISLGLGSIWLSCNLKRDLFQEENSVVDKKKIIKARKIFPLKKGDKIAIVAPAYKTPEDFLPNNLIRWGKAQGFEIILDYLVSEEKSPFSACDKQRIKSFQEALDNNEIRAIWALRGGYGSVRIIDKLDFSKFEKNPKWIIGYSDITVFHSHIHALYNIPTLHGPMAKEVFGYSSFNSIKTLFWALKGKKLDYKIPVSKYNKEGLAKGFLIGGNLSILYSLCGTKSSMKTQDKILFIEDIGEYFYHIDRMMINLKRNDFFLNLKGLIIGTMTELKNTKEFSNESLESIILNVLSEYNFPIAFDFPAGHSKENLALIFGKEIILSSKKETVSIAYS